MNFKLFFPVMLLASSSVYGDDAVTGRVVTPDGRGVAGYPVVVKSADQTHEWISSTDRAGNFAVQELPPGEYVLAPANEPNLSTTFRIKEQAATDSSSPKDVGEIEVAPGSKF